MSKFRITVSLIVLTLIMMSTYQLAAAKTEVGFSHYYDRDTSITKAEESTPSSNGPLSPSPLAQEECFDLPLGVVTSTYACSNLSQVPGPAWWSLEIGATKTLNASAPSNP